MTVRSAVGLGVVLSMLWGCDGASTPHSTTEAVTAPGATSVTVTPTACGGPKLASSDPGKSTPKTCPKVTIALPSAAYRAKQQQYLTALAKQRPSWSGLSSEQQSLEQLKLKRSIVGQ